MPELTRRRSTDAREECWHSYYGDLHAGTIAIRTGNPHDEDPWEWTCGFYPGSHPGDHQNGTAATFDEARAGFESARLVFLSKRTEADFQAWRDQRDWTARKYALWDAGKRLEPPSYGPGKPCSRYEVPLRRGVRHARPRGGADARASHHCNRSSTSFNEI
jgi:hypothetical protein